MTEILSKEKDDKRSLEKKQEQLEDAIKKIKKRNEDDDFMLVESIKKLEYAKDYFNSVDKELFDLLEEKHNMIKKIRVKQLKMEDEIQHEADKIKREIEQEKEELDEKHRDKENDKKGGCAKR